MGFNQYTKNNILIILVIGTEEIRFFNRHQNVKTCAMNFDSRAQ